MAVIINSQVDGTFTLNGISYGKIYQPLQMGVLDIGIYNINDTRQYLISPTEYTEFVIDGSSYGTQALTIAALIPVILSLESEADSLGGYNITQLLKSNEDDTAEGVITFNQGSIFTPIVAPAWQQGLLFTDSSTGALTYYNSESEISQQIGEETFVPVRNDTGVTIPNGSAVYVTGAVGLTPTVGLSIANGTTASRCIGVATHSIENNTEGYITTLGSVNDIDTSAFVAGEELYLSSTVAGAFQNTKPIGTNETVLIGVCLVSNPSNGSIKVQLRPDSETAIKDIAQTITGAWTFNNVGGLNIGAGTITDTKISNWDNAFSWGDHSLEGYLTSLSAGSLGAGNLGSGVLPYITANGTSSAFKVPFINTTGSASGNFGIRIDNSAHFTYNPSTNTLVVPNITGALAGNATTATRLATARNINGTSFNGTANITTANWGTSRNLSIGGTSKAVNGSANVTWSISEIGITKTNIDALGIDATTLDSLDSLQFLRSDADDETGAAIKTWFGGAITGQTGSSARVQINGFLRTGNVYIDAGGLTPDGTRSLDYLSNLAGELYWNNSGVGNGKVITNTNVNATLTQFLRSDVADTKSAGNLIIATNVGLSFANTGTGAEGRSSQIYSDAVNTIWRAYDGDIIIKDDATTRITIGRTTGNFTNTGTITSQGTGDSSFAGNVGIGTTAPRNLLSASIAGGGNNPPALGSATGVISSALVSNAFGLITGANNLGTVWMQSQAVEGTVAAYAMSLQPSGGNVNIGTITDSAYKLNVSGNAYISSSILAEGGLMTTRTTGLGDNINHWLIRGGSGDNTRSGGFRIQSFNAALDGACYFVGSKMRIGTVTSQAFELTTANTVKLLINAGGNVSIGNANDTYKLDVSGDARFTGDVTANKFFEASDITLKTNIKPLSESFKTFEFKEELGVKRYGVIAQEIEVEYPELVKTNEEGIKAVNYTDLLVMKLAEQENKIDRLEKLVEQLINNK